MRQNISLCVSILRLQDNKKQRSPEACFEFWKHRLTLIKSSVNQRDVMLFASSSVDFHSDMVISFHFPSILVFPNSSSISRLEFFPYFSVDLVWIHLKKNKKNTERGSLNPSNLKADVRWLPTSKSPVNCREGEIIYLWLAFSLVNVNELSTWLLSEPWPSPHGQYIIRLRGAHTFVSTLPC